ncbi:competence/damage-inducible protein A [Thermodesulforhabdus norvegica]|uniref:Predicted nucleotide-utilizing enzyme n=1 Tax=Thermodesulforhabdus norvegica TaxID=39841 RepID=A0A1I4QP00_9BACT|nr:molybdopterin-binding protein [Thermodesulforhabdus norvegica]SFM41440.1 Predicted nucleotide-utilizing enzyme [Thermodesulforhabdus norvegica]
MKSAVVTVGNELIYGERSDDNRTWMLSILKEKGLPAGLALTLPDDENSIALWINVLKDKGYGPVFVSGGIGGTHDDRTRQGIALGLGRPLICHEECFKILQKRYGRNFSEQRQRMAWLPQGSMLIPNEIGAPGFYVDEVYAFPGFPEMLRPMFIWVLDRLVKRPGERWLVREWHLPLSEGVIAADVERFVEKHPALSVGLYPHIGEKGSEVTVRLRFRPGDEKAVEEFTALIETYAVIGERKGGGYK